MSEGPILNETIRLTIEAPKKVDGGLADLVKQLDNVHKHIERVNDALNGMKLGPSASRSMETVLAQIKALQTKVAAQGGDILKLPDLSKNLGVDAARFEAFLARRRKALKDHYAFSTQLFSSASQAAKHVAAFERESAGGRRLALGQLLTPTVQEVRKVTASGGVAAKVEGQIPLTIPAAQVQASVIGEVKLNIAGAQITGGGGYVGGPLKGPDGKFLSQKAVAEKQAAAAKQLADMLGVEAPQAGTPAGVTGAGRKRRKGARTLPRDNVPVAGEFERVRVETADYVRETITSANALGQMVGETWDSVEQGIIKTVKKSTTGVSPLREFQTRKQLALLNFEAAKNKVKGDPKALAQLQHDQGSQMRAILADPALQAALGPVETKRLQTLLEARAQTFETQGQQTLHQHQDREREAQRRRSEMARTRSVQHQTAEVESERRLAAQSVRNERKRLMGQYSDTWTGKQEMFGGLAIAEEARAQRLEQSLAKNKLIRDRQRRQVQGDIEGARLNAFNFSKMAGAPDPKAGRPTGEYARFLSGLKAFTPMGALANLTKVTGWAASVMVLYKSIELARYSIERFLEIGQQTARLEQVFKGVGGTAQQLAGDVMKLAEVNARDTREALESATEWARLGLSRKEVGEAVRVSMVAANVAQMRTSETTKQLSSLMHIYGLEARDLNGVLGMLASTSLHYNVTLEDLFTGLDRSAGVARQAGMGFEELQGIIGATVGKTGQSGIIVGNTVKSILTQFSNPNIPKTLRSFGVEALTDKGEEKSGTQILRDVFVAYQGMDDRKRRILTTTLAGRLQSGRFVAMLDSYLQAQKLAIDSNLTGADEANARVTDTGAAQWTKMRGGWDRFAVGGGKLGGRVIAPVVGGVLHGAGAAMDWASDAFDWANYHWMGVLPKVEGSSFQNEIQKHHHAAAAEGVRARLFRTVGAALIKARPDAVASMTNIAASEMDAGNADAFKQAVGSHNMLGAQQILEQSAKQAETKSKSELGAELERRKTEHAEAVGKVAAARAEYEGSKPYGAVEEAQTRYDRANASLHTAWHKTWDSRAPEVLAEWRRWIKERDEAEAELNQRKADWAKTGKRDEPGRMAKAKQALGEAEQEEARLAEEATRAVESLNEAEGETPEVLERKQQYLDLLKQQQMLMQSLDQLASQGGLETMGGRLDAQVGALQQQIDMLEKTETMLRGRGTDEDRRSADELRDEAAGLRANRAALDSPAMRELAGIYDDRQIAQHRAGEEASSYGVGYTETGKLLARKAELEKQLDHFGRKEAMGTLDDNDATRAKEYEIQLWHTQEQIQSRTLELSRQERQIRLDAAREFNKGLLLAGPGEMLQRFHVSQLMQRRGGISSGEFFAMSPETRRMYFEAMGGEAGMTNRMERREMRGWDGNNLGGRRGQWQGELAGYQQWLRQERPNMLKKGVAREIVDAEDHRRRGSVTEAWKAYQGARAGHGMTLEEEQQGARRNRENVEHWNSWQRESTTWRLGKQPPMPLPLDATARQIASMGTAALNAAGALNRLYAVVDQLVNKLHPAGHQASNGYRLDLNPGGAMGARLPS